MHTPNAPRDRSETEATRSRTAPPAPAPPKGAGRTLLWVLLGCGGLLVLGLLTTTAVVALWYLLPSNPRGPVDDEGPPPGPGIAVTRANAGNVKELMTRREVEQVFGAGRKVTQHDCEKAIAQSSACLAVNLRRIAHLTGIKAWHQWPAGDGGLFVGF